MPYSALVIGSVQRSRQRSHPDPGTLRPALPETPLASLGMKQCAYYRSSVAASMVGKWPNLNIQLLTEGTSTPIQRVSEERS